MAKSSAATFARAFVSIHGVDCAHRLGAIGPTIGREIEEVDADNFEGALVRAVGLPRGAILINNAIREPGRKLFTLAHELGHYVLPGHGEEVTPCRRDVLENFGDRISSREREANVFAAEVTMPEEVVRPLAAHDPSFAVVEAIVERCGTSLTASTYRLVDVTTHALAVVWSEAGKVRWYHRSEELLLKVRVDVLSPGTLAADCFRGEQPPDDWVEVPAEAWFFADAVRDGATVREATRYLPRYGATLTLLHVTDLIELRSDYQEPDDDELDPVEFTLRRRHWPTKR